MIRFSTIFTVLLLVVACSGNGKQQAADDSGATFVFSNQSPPAPGNPVDDWCGQAFPDAAVINADPQNFNRRIFAFGENPYKVTISFGNIVAAFALKKMGKQVAVFTSDNYPECLSNRNNFSVSTGTGSLHYDNHKHISCDVQLVNTPNGSEIVIEMPPDANFGLEVRKK